MRRENGAHIFDIVSDVLSLLIAIFVALKLRHRGFRLEDLGVPHADGVAVSVECASGDRQIVASHVLLALGRTPNTDDLGLEAGDIKTDARGFVVVDMVPGLSPAELQARTEAELHFPA